MNKKFLLMCTAAVLSISAFSVKADDVKSLPITEEGSKIEQMDKRMRPNPEQMGEKLADKLDLTEAQRAQAKKLREDGHKKVKPLMEEMKKTREKMDKLRKENMEEFEKILTPEQKNKFEKMKEEMKKRHPKGHKFRGHRGEHKNWDNKK